MYTNNDQSINLFPAFSNLSGKGSTKRSETRLKYRKHAILDRFSFFLLSKVVGLAVEKVNMLISPLYPLKL